jgi:hypothetical protein
MFAGKLATPKCSQRHARSCRPINGVHQPPCFIELYKSVQVSAGVALLKYNEKAKLVERLANS